jgi:NAD(P)H-dependent flavin oxidoreductase YrpB (nitropropane dioxygenase family)
MGTRFVAVRECIAHDRYKEALVRASETDTVVIERSVGRPGRALHNDAADFILKLEAEGATIEQLLPYVGGEANKVAARQGEMEKGFVWAGQGTGLITDVPSVAELIQRMVDETERIGSRICPMLRP